jgi:hypothetical protein
MSRQWLQIPVLLLAVALCAAAQQTKGQGKAGATASGVFLGRSGKPMAKARLTLGEFAGDGVILYAKIKFPATTITAVTDASGHFQFQGFTPGTYTIVYQLEGGSSLLPAEINIRDLLAVAKSILPELRDTEIGKSGEPYKERPWGPSMTLLRGHTLYLQGPNMKVWNATARARQQGAHFEIRRGVIWMQDLTDKSQIKLDAWSF